MIWISLKFEIVKPASADWQVEEIIIFAAKEKTSSRKLLIQESDLRGGSKKTSSERRGSILRIRTPLIFQILLCRNWHLGFNNLVAEASSGRSLRLSG